MKPFSKGGCSISFGTTSLQFVAGVLHKTAGSRPFYYILRFDWVFINNVFFSLQNDGFEPPIDLEKVHHKYNRRR